MDISDLKGQGTIHRFDVYDDITIMDDYPGIWDTQSQLKCRMIKVKEFVGDVSDTELKKTIAENL